jgi:hypothetical protein
LKSAPAFFAPLLVMALGCSRTETAAGGDAEIVPPGRAVSTAPAPTSSSALTLNPADAPPATMKLIDPGQPPRRKLRYAWRTGQRETLVMDLRTSASTEEGSSRNPEMQLPPVHIVLAIDPQETSAAGDLTYAWHVTATAVRPDAQTPAALTDGMRSEVAAIEHLSGTAVVTSCGISTRISIDPEPWRAAERLDGGRSAADGSLADKAAPPSAGVTGQMVEQVRQTLRDVAAPFPQEEVGPGARWQKLSQLASRDAHVTQTEIFTLTQLTAMTGALDDVLSQTAPPQPLLSPGAQARIESMLASGDGKTQFELTRLVPQTKFAGTTTMVVSSRSGDQEERRMTMTMHVEIVIAGSAP